MDFAVRVFEITNGFPTEEKYGLTAQLRRCCSSVPSNIAEGAGRGSNPQFRRFLEIAMGSINEAQTQLELAFRVKILIQDQYEALMDEGLQIYKMILTFYNKLEIEK